MVDTLSAVFNSDRDEQKFNEMWNAVVEESAELSIDEPVLPRQRRPPRRLDGGAEPHQDQDCKEFYRRIYYSTIDAALSCLKNRFQSPAFTVARNIEAAVVQALSTDNSPSLDAIVQHFGQDLDEKRLKLHLSMLRDVCSQHSPSTLSIQCINDVVHLMQQKPEWLQLFPERPNFCDFFSQYQSQAVQLNGAFRV